MGGGLALLLAPWALHALLKLAPQDLPRLDEVHLDGAVMAFALAASLLAGLAAGLVPAMQVTQPRLMDVLKQGSGGLAARGRSRSALVVAEVALAFVLAAGAGLMIRTLSGLLKTSSGLASPERVLVADVDLPRARVRRCGSRCAGRRKIRCSSSRWSVRKCWRSTRTCRSRWPERSTRSSPSRWANGASR